MPHFECGAIDHSATSPRPQTGAKHPIGGYVSNVRQPDKAARKNGARRIVRSPFLPTFQIFLLTTYRI
jgi:hypothetical protein